MADRTGESESARKIPAVYRPKEITSGYEILSTFFEPHQRLEGGRLGFVGAPGSGKTYAARVVVQAMLVQRVCDLIFTLDDKGRDPQFAGAVRSNPGPPWSPAHALSLSAMPLQSHEKKNVVFRGDLRAGVPCDGEAIARLALHMSRQMNVAICVNVDELDRVLTDGGRSWVAPSIRTVQSQGRALNLWLTWTTQQPQRIPNEPYDQATALCFFRLEARAARYVDKVCMFDEEMTALLPTLERGEFVVHVPGKPWDRKVYKF